MLSYALAIAVALSSLILFLTAFLMSDIHRKDDFLWSGLGLFYALILWFCARNITGAVLLGQASASILLISFVWQTLKLRKAIANPERAKAIESFSILKAINGFSQRKKSQVQTSPAASVGDSPDVVTESKIAIPQTTDNQAESSSQKPGKVSSFKGFFGKKKKSSITNTKLDSILEEPETRQPEKPAAISQDTTADTNNPPAKISPEPIEKQPEAENKSLEVVKETEENQGVTKELEIAPPVIDPETNPEIDQVKEPQPAEEKPVVEISQTDESLSTEAPETNIEPSDNSISSNSEPKTIITPTIPQDAEGDDTPTETPVETTIEVQTEESTNPSSLDTLETVEVAEILDERPDRNDNETNSDRTNIIEVTTTDIDEEKDSPSDRS